MTLNLCKCEASSSNSNGDALIGIPSNANALKEADISCFPSKPEDNSPVIPFTGEAPQVCYYQVTSVYEVIDLDDSSSEEERVNNDEDETDLDLSLKIGQSGEVIDIEEDGEDTKEFSSSSVLSTEGQIQGEIKSEVKDKSILLGCQSCHIYVMVSKDNLACPLCRKNSRLIEIPSGKPFKKPKLEN